MMKLKGIILWLLGGATLAGLALGGLVALGPLEGAGSMSDRLLHGTLLICFWLGYVTVLICVLCYLGDRIFGHGLERDDHPLAIKD
jgi:hypothetical protein